MIGLDLDVGDGGVDFMSLRPIFSPSLASIELELGLEIWIVGVCGV